VDEELSPKLHSCLLAWSSLSITFTRRRESMEPEEMLKLVHRASERYEVKSGDVVYDG
jgi:hypothetical protein